MVKIDDRFLKEGSRIREEYLENLEFIVNKEQEMLRIKDDLFKLITDIKSFGTINEIDEELVANRIQKLDRELKDLQKSIKPKTERIDELRSDADRLYDIIKEKYPDITQDDLKDQLYPYISEIEKGFSFLQEIKKEE